MIATLSQAAESMHGMLHGDDRSFDGISTDTRSIREGQMFFALQGPNFDGCDYVGQAKNSGAAGAVVSRLVDVDIAQIQVDDAKLALGRFAAAWRDSKNVRVVGITGSNGKTTLKELVAACLRTAHQRWRLKATSITILACRSCWRGSVMSMNTPCWKWVPIMPEKSRTSRRWRNRMLLLLPMQVRRTWKASARYREWRTPKARYCRSRTDLLLLC